MNHSYLIFSISLSSMLVVGGLHAQDKKVPIDIEARKASVGNLETHIDQLEARLKLVAEDVIRLDKRVENSVANVVGLLGKAKDSKESRTGVAKTKADAIQGLKNMIQVYQQKRAEVDESIRSGKTDVPIETLSGDIKEFDKRVEKRVEQILTLTQSFTQHKDFDKYVNTGGGVTWDGWEWNNREINESWRQDRRQVRHTDKNRDEVIEALKKSIADLEQRRRSLKVSLGQGTNSATQRALYKTDVSRIDGVLLARKRQLEQLESSIEQPKTKEVGQDQAWDLNMLLKDAKENLRDDFFGIFHKYDELNRGRGKIALLKINLAARKKWLVEHEAGK